MVSPKTTAEEAVAITDDMSRWEDDGGGNVGADYEWLPTTSPDKAAERFPRVDADCSARSGLRHYVQMRRDRQRDERAN